MKNNIITLISFSPGTDLTVLRKKVARFAQLMAEVTAEKDSHNGISLEILLSLMVYYFQCGPDELGGKLRTLCDALDKGETTVTKMTDDPPKKPH